MKNSSRIVLLLSILGAILLVASSVYFGSPLFGWLIIIAIVAIYVISCTNAFRGLAKVDKERDSIDRYASLYDAGSAPSDADVQGEGLLNQRIRFLRSLKAKKVALSVHDLEFLKTVWASKEELVSKSSGGVVILLGLMGTFFGLMLSISTAGSAIDATATSETTLDIIQNIFSSMKGIFGSSLCGLFAALILNTNHSIYESAHDSLLAKLDEFTLFHLIPTLESHEDVAVEIRNLIDVTKASDDMRASILSENLTSLQKSLIENMTSVSEKGLVQMAAAESQALSGIQKSVAELSSQITTVQTSAVEGIRTSVSDLSHRFEEIQKNAVEGFETAGKDASLELKNSLSSVTSGISLEMQKLSQNVDAFQTGIVSGLKSELASLSSAVEAALAEGVKLELSSSREQWNSFMESLKASSADVARCQKEGLETLRSVAEGVAEKAEAGSAGLSNTVANEIEHLSSEVKDSFSELAKSSSALVSSQQSLIQGIENRVVKENESTEALGSNIAEAAKMMRVNQSEFAANLEMFGKGIEAVLSKLSGDVPEREGEQNFIEQLNMSLEAFHERAGEVLMENAVKTQEILLEILEQSQRAPGAASKADS